MKPISFSGCGTALITPFKNGDVDCLTYASLVERQVEAGVDFLVPLATTGETPCLEDSEKLELLETAKEHAHGLPLLVGCGTNSLKHTLRNIKLLDSHGADAYLVVVPYYNKPTQEGQYQYFKAIAESVDKPIVIYNVPGRTGANMAAETALRLAEIPNIIGTKEASSNYAQISAVIRNAPEGFSVLSGNDDETLSIIATGGHGVISVASNIAPALVSEMTRSALSGDFVRARELHHRLTPLFKNCFVESNPIPVKAGMAAMGLIQNELRLPLIKATDATFSLMERTVRDLGLL